MILLVDTVISRSLESDVLVFGFRSNTTLEDDTVMFSEGAMFTS